MAVYLHDRSEVLHFLNARFIERPKEITVILGPQTSGKTKLDQALFSEEQPILDIWLLSECSKCKADRSETI